MGSTANRLFLHAVLSAPLMIISYINQEAGYQVGWWAGEGPRFLVYLQGTLRLAQQRSKSDAARPVNPRVTHLLIGLCCSLCSLSHILSVRPCKAKNSPALHVIDVPKRKH